MEASRARFALRSVICCAGLSLSLASGLVACGDGDDDDGGGSGAASGSGGTSGSGGAGGTAGGSAGRGGGGGGGASGTGASGGTGTGGAGDAGAGGSEAGRGGDGTSGESGASAGVGASAGEGGAAGDASAGGSSGEGGGAAGESGAGGGNGGGTIETCFDGLRELEGTSQISTRENAGEQIRLRLALETADRIGTSGTYPWAAVRLALEIDGVLICLDEAELASAYMGTHHNCSDQLVFDYDGRSYEVGSPDARGLEGATLTVSSGGSVVRGPVSLTATECVAAGGVSDECRSGGPC